MRANAGQDVTSSFHRRVSRLAGRVARKALRELRALLEPSSVQRLRRRFILPIRNVMLWGKPVTVHAAGYIIRLFPQGAAAAAIWSGADYQKSKLVLLTRMLEADSVFLDIGADVGIFSLFASKVSPTGKIFALESDKAAFDLLSRNTQLNAARNVTLVHVAPVDYLRSATDSHIDFMKVDAAGAELLVLEAASNILQRPDAPILLYEAFTSLTRTYDYHPVEIFWLLQRHGFRFFTLDSNSGKLTIPQASRVYDSTVLAAKPTHPAYSKIEELTR